MFGRKPLLAAAAAGPAGKGFALPSVLANPFVGAGGTGALILLTGVLAVAVFGDPSAGAPSLRAPLSAESQDGAERIRRLIGPEQAFGSPTLDTLQPGMDVAAEGMGETPFQGEAVITLPGSGGGAGAPAASGGRKYAASPLPPAPIAGLVAPSPTGPLPVIAGGKRPSDAYARPFTSNGKPKVALVIGGLGLNSAQTRAAIERLPAEVTLSFVPYADGLQGWIDLARAQGHEVLLEIPMEPVDFPENDPGPGTLMAQARPEETVKRLEWLLSRATGYFGVTNYLGGKFLSSEGAMSPFLGALKSRGLAFLDDGSAGGSGGGVPRASADRIVDQQLTPEALDKSLLALEAAALQRGQALGAGFAYPLTLEQAARWAEGLPARGYQLAPASAITRR